MTLQQVQVIAHRGASEDAPEHTLAAYKRALADGAHAVEADVRLTRDGHLVCVHDRRIDRTSSGSGVLSTLELADLAELDWGRWRDDWADYEDPVDPEAPDRDRRGILTLRGLLEAVRDAGTATEIAIETKHPTRYAGLVERTLVQLLSEFGWLGRDAPVRVMSFSSLSLRRLRGLAPDLRTVYLMERVPVRFRNGSLPPYVPVAGPSIEVVRAYPSYVLRAQQRGHQVHVWTVDRTRDVQLCLDLGVDAIITNRPRHVLEMAREHAQQAR